MGKVTWLDVRAAVGTVPDCHRALIYSLSTSALAPKLRTKPLLTLCSNQTGLHHDDYSRSALQHTIPNHVTHYIKPGISMDCTVYNTTGSLSLWYNKLHPHLKHRDSRTNGKEMC